MSSYVVFFSSVFRAPAEQSNWTVDILDFLLCFACYDNMGEVLESQLSVTFYFFRLKVLAHLSSTSTFCISQISGISSKTGHFSVDSYNIANSNLSFKPNPEPLLGKQTNI